MEARIVRGIKWGVYSCHLKIKKFVSSTTGIKRRRDKKFCFDVRLGPNPSTRQTTCIHGAWCNSEELRGIRMFEVQWVVLRKQVATSSLSKSLFCQLSSKRQVTHNPRVTKKEKQTWPTASNINQTKQVILELS